MSQSFSLRWLIDFAKAGFSWVAKNPLLIVLMVLIISYNQFIPRLGLDFKNLTITRADSIWQFVIQAFHFFTSASGIALWLITFVFATAITIFNSGVMLAVLAGKSKPGQTGLKTLCSMSLIKYMLLQVFVSAILVIAGTALLWLIVFGLSFRGLTGSIIIGIFVAIAYPLFYAAMSAMAIILAVPVSLKEQFAFTKVLLKKPNAIRLGLYYLVRIGGETLVGYIALVIAHELRVPGVWTAVLVIVIISIPYALVRTTGLIIKLDMLKDEIWFANYFANYYAHSKRDTLQS